MMQTPWTSTSTGRRPRRRWCSTRMSGCKKVGHDVSMVPTEGHDVGKVPTYVTDKEQFFTHVNDPQSGLRIRILIRTWNGIRILSVLLLYVLPSYSFCSHIFWLILFSKIIMIHSKLWNCHEISINSSFILNFVLVDRY